MNPITHFFISWDAANIDDFDKRDRLLLTVSGIIPDADGFGALPELLTMNSENPIIWFSKYHRLLTHNISFGIIFTIFVFFVAHKKFKTAIFSLFLFNIHLFCDIIGGAGPDGSYWPVPYLLPFSDKWQLYWEHQWLLNAWQNILITITAIIIMFIFAYKKGYSFIEIFSQKADKLFVNTVRNRIDYFKKIFCK